MSVSVPAPILSVFVAHASDFLRVDMVLYTLAGSKSTSDIIKKVNEHFTF